jgi:hypothetical protein
MSVNLHTAFAVETHLVDGQWLEKQVDMVKLRMLRVGTRRSTVWWTGGQHLVLLKTFIIIFININNQNNKRNTFIIVIIINVIIVTVLLFTKDCPQNCRLTVSLYPR